MNVLRFSYKWQIIRVTVVPIFTAIALLCPILAQAQHIEHKGIFYNISGNEATVTFTPLMEKPYKGKVIIPNKIKHNGHSYTVTAIGDFAFTKCADLKSINIPNSVQKIGISAFSCCDNLRKITIPNSVTEIGSGVFSNCSNLESVILPDSLSVIPDCSFSGCERLKSAVFPLNVKKIGSWAFARCSGISHIDIPNSVTEIELGSFFGCPNIKSISIPSSVTKIGLVAFSNCNQLSSIVVDGNNPIYDSRNNSNAIILTATNSLIFGCASSIIPYSIAEIGEYAFFACDGISSLYLPETLEKIGFNAFNGCSHIKNISIPNSVKDIKSSTFKGCSQLKSVSIPNSVTNIGWEAFADCEELESISIPDSITTIGFATFANCKKLKSVHFPNSVIWIDSRAFSGCTHLDKTTTAKIEQIRASQVKKDILVNPAGTNFGPNFPGGTQTLYKFVQNYAPTPIDGPQSHRKRVAVRFMVDKKGNVTNVSIVNSHAPDRNQEAISIVKRLPAFVPATTDDGQFVDTWFTIPIVFHSTQSQ